MQYKLSGIRLKVAIQFYIRDMYNVYIKQEKQDPLDRSVVQRRIRETGKPGYIQENQGYTGEPVIQENQGYTGEPGIQENQGYK